MTLKLRYPQCSALKWNCPHVNVMTSSFNIYRFWTDFSVNCEWGRVVFELPAFVGAVPLYVQLILYVLWRSGVHSPKVLLGFYGNSGLFHEMMPGSIILSVQLFDNFIIHKKWYYQILTSVSVEKNLFNLKTYWVTDKLKKALNLVPLVHRGPVSL